ncbi:cytochrome P450 monooxygenase-like protein [Hypoxylon trugodes]|uniref:cytochrome P450 monooxygenase-like protein n=1 Tax=Hypoxylon trugodes TaxID=326681 RepID=UPI0021A039C8|nr:cytochrome P450 monooxygenase-like protein [Hypoxylon trugodes]KAI1387314.1 cytochrome P450 monooxygenase-like protein [Hypoxylon trugodes]
MIRLLLGVFGGFIAHIGFFIRNEWHMSGAKIIVAHLALCSTLAYVLIHMEDSAGAVYRSLATLTTWYLLSLFSSILIYRVFFHATRSFPGPKLAAVTKLWHVFHVRDSRNFLFMEKLHKKYGNFVRTGTNLPLNAVIRILMLKFAGPNEISIFHPAAIQLLDGQNNETTKDGWYDLMHPRSSVIFSRDPNEHKERRMVWSQSLSTKAMDILRPRVAAQALSLSQCIAKYEGGPVDVNEIMSWFSFDVMAEAVFGKDFGLMSSQAMLPAIGHRDRALALVGPLNDAIWIALLGFSLIPFYGRVQDWFRMVAFCDEHVQERLKRGEDGEKTDMMAWFLDEYESLKGTKDVQARRNLLSGSVVTAVVAGSDTVRASLIAIWWYLSKYPEHAKKIRLEIQNISFDDANALSLLPHLNGVINEVLRLIPPAMTGNNRMTGPNGLLIDGVFIPPFTKVAAPKYVIQRMESAFKYPDQFIPERWYSRPELIRDKQAFAPFSVGNRQCVGKALAYTEVRLSTAILLQRYDVSFTPGYDPETMWRDMKDRVTAQPGQVLCVFKSM